MTALDLLWPPATSLRKTLGTDANTLDMSVFLAVHQPMRLRRVKYGNTVEKAPVVSERDVLQALLTDDGEGRVIIPIAGPSGSGKSHVIRWLEAELTSRDDACTRHVILVTKNSSLKSILKRILRDLAGPRYDKIRKSLERASESLPEVAAKDLRTRLVAVLMSEANVAGERLRDDNSANAIIDQQAYSLGPEAAALLDDPELWRVHFYGDEANPTGVLARLAEHVTREGSANRRHQFEPSDFEGLASVVALKNLSLGARRPIGRLADEKHRQAYADVLNEVLDQATQNLLDLGGTPLSEVFLELRRALLEDSKELVILVEDFAVLSGMQGALLDALIHEARVAGIQKYCTIRSALAYTHGYQPMQRDTVMTRARAEWVIEDVPGTETEILNRAVELVGAYWNAARWGIDALREQHERDLSQDWVQVFEPEYTSEEESRNVGSFERSQASYPLFPLNTAAIRQLVREKCVVNDRLVFNPRLIIDGVVLDVAKLRKHFEKGVFPPSTLGNSILTTADVVQVINRQAGDQQERLLTLVTYWADRPDSLAEAARLPGAVYEAFGLLPIDFGAPVPDPSPASPGDPKTRVQGSATHAPTITDPFEAKWKSVLDNWQGGNRLSQTEARHIRTWIGDAVLSTLPPDWPGSRSYVDKSVLAKDHTYLPNARGAEGLEDVDAAISLCGDDIWSDPLSAAPIRQALEAIIRFHGINETKGVWSYSGAEIQAARYANFVASQRSRLLRWLISQRSTKQQQTSFSLRHLVESRLMAAAVLGTGVKGGNHLESAMDVLFRDLPQSQPTHDLPERWLKLLEEAQRHGERSRADLIELTAARQGITGTKIYAIDVATLHEPIRDFLKTWELSDGPKDHSAFTSTMTRGIKARRDELRDWHTKTIEWLGEAFDKQAMINEVSDLLTEANQLALCHATEIETIRKLRDQFRDSPVAEALNSSALALSEPPDGSTLPALAYDYAKVIEITEGLESSLLQCFDNIEREIDSTLETGGVNVVETMIAQVASELEALQAIVNDYKEIRSHDCS